MSALRKEGLDYFTVDCDIENNRKIYFLESKHGPLAFTVIIKLWARIFKRGYYLKWDVKEEILFARQTGVPQDDVHKIVMDCLAEKIFENKLFKKYGVLTSKEVQRRFMSAITRRKSTKIEKMLTLISCNDYNNAVIVDTMSTLKRKKSTSATTSNLTDSNRTDSNGTERNAQARASDSDEPPPTFVGTLLSIRFFTLISGIFPESIIDKEEDQAWFIEKVQKNNHYSTLNFWVELDAWEDWLTKESRKKRAHHKHRLPENFKQALHNWLKKSIEFNLKRQPVKPRASGYPKPVTCRFCQNKYQLQGSYGGCDNPKCKELYYTHGDLGEPVERFPVKIELDE